MRRTVFQRTILIGLAVLLAVTANAETTSRLDIETYLAFESISSVTASPDGEYLAFTSSKYDLETDGSVSAVWMQPTAGGDPVRMTELDSSAWSPAWSPDDRYLAVLSDRGDQTQVWLLDRRGGDARQLTDITQGVDSFKWSPDGTRLLLIIQDPSPADLDDEERPNPRPYVIDRLQFKRDYVGYLDRRRTHIYVLDIAAGSLRQVTFGDYDDDSANWSPDGEHIVFVSNRTAEPELNRNTDLWRIDISEEQPEPQQLTTAPYADTNPVYSPDGKTIAFQSTVSDGLPVYAIPQLMLLDLESGESTRVASLTEIQAWGMQFSADSSTVYAITEYRGEQQLVSVDVASGETTRVIHGELAVTEFELASDGTIYAEVSRPQLRPEVYRVRDDSLQPLTAINRELMANIKLGAVQKHTYTAEDGTALETFVVFPPDYKKGKRYPAVLLSHGGPWAQWDWRFNFEAQLFAANGYVVVMPNFRGSWGYGQAFADALIRKWGDVDYRDSMDAMDFAIEKGWVDADRMATYGWSWGGFLTNHIITQTDRFKAAISGASETLVAVNYGHDEWLRLWEEELGPPWLAENREKWDQVSPFWSLDKVTTPTLVVGGEHDWNMPIINSEQLYIALKRQGVPTQLIVYPGAHHNFSVASYERDFYERLLGWVERYLRE
jgi:dipeptidyl aminopeptidase/acylaminoacyl peptidase